MDRAWMTTCVRWLGRRLLHIRHPPSAIRHGVAAWCLILLAVTAHAEPRIVSFSPAMTGTVVALGMQRGLVGVGTHDPFAPPPEVGAAVVGSFMDPDPEALLAARPDVVLFPATQSGVPASLRTLAEGRFSVFAAPYPATLDAALEQVAAVGAAVGRDDAGEALAGRLRRDLDVIRAECRAVRGEAPAPRVLLCFAVDPVWASGPGSVNDDLLAVVGAVNALPATAGSAVTLDAEGLLGVDPDVIVLLRPREEAAGGAPGDGDDPFAALRGLPLRAVREGRLVRLEGPAVLVPGPNVVETARRLAEAVWADAVP